MDYPRDKHCIWLIYGLYMANIYIYNYIYVLFVKGMLTIWSYQLTYD